MMQRGRSFKTGGIGSVSSDEKTFQLHSCLNLTSKTSGHKPQFASLLLNHTIYVSFSDNSHLALLFSLVFLLLRLFSLRLLLLFSSSHHSFFSFRPSMSCPFLSLFPHFFSSFPFYFPRLLVLSIILVSFHPLSLILVFFSIYRLQAVYLFLFPLRSPFLFISSLDSAPPPCFPSFLPFSTTTAPSTCFFLLTSFSFSLSHLPFLHILSSTFLLHPLLLPYVITQFSFPLFFVFSHLL